MQTKLIELLSNDLDDVQHTLYELVDDYSCFASQLSLSSQRLFIHHIQEAREDIKNMNIQLTKLKELK